MLNRIEFFILHAIFTFSGANKNKEQPHSGQTSPPHCITSEKVPHVIGQVHYVVHSLTTPIGGICPTFTEPWLVNLAAITQVAQSVRH